MLKTIHSSCWRLNIFYNFGWSWVLRDTSTYQWNVVGPEICSGGLQYLCYMCVYSVMSNPLALLRLWPTRLLCPWDFSGKSTEMGCNLLLQGIFLNEGLIPHLLHLLHGAVLSHSLWLHRPQTSRLLCPCEFSRQEYWSGSPWPPLGDPGIPGIEPRSLAL